MRAAIVMAGLAVALAGPGPAADQPDIRSAVRSWVHTHEAKILSEFRELLAVPNLASDGPGIRQNAELIARRLALRGIAARLLDGEGGPPVVYGERRAPGARKTLVIYAHYDGQPVDP